MISLGMEAQNISFADANFKAKLLSASPSNTVAKDDYGNYAAIDTNGDGEISWTEANEIRELNISNANISSLEGLSNFSILNHLDCSNNQISTIDVNDFLLGTLDCSNNQISSLDLSSLSYEIYSLNCSYNLLTDLQIANLFGLNTLDCSHNQITNLELPAFQPVWSGPQPVYNINISHNFITNFTLADNIPYENVDCSHNQIPVLDVKNKKITSLNCSYNQISELNFQDRNIQTLSLLNVSNNNFTSICKNEGDVFPSTGSVTQTVCGNPVLGFDQGFKNFLLASTAGPCTYSDGQKAKDINGICLDLDPDRDGEMHQADLDNVASITFYYDPSYYATNNLNFVKTKGINYLTNLKTINSNYGGTSSYATDDVGSLEIDGLQKLEYVSAGQFYFKSLSIKNTPKLTKILVGSYHSYASGSALGYEFINCPLLEEVKSFATNINSLVFQNTPKVKYIDVTGNKLSSFDTSTIPNIEELYIGNYRSYGSSVDIINLPKNTMTSLDLSGHIKLKRLSFTKGSLSSLNLQNCTSLQLVNGSDNELTSLNVNGLNINYIPGSEDIEFGGINLSLNENKLENVELNNAKIRNVNLDNNQLKYLYLKNGFADNVTFNNNPNIKFICTDETELNPIKTRVNQYGYTNTCNVNSYCSFNPGGNYNTITGTVRFDGNNNGCDINDEVFEHMKLKINDVTTTGETFVKNDGTYNFFTQTGGFTVTAEPENTSLYTVTPSTFTINFADNNNHISTQNICVTKNGNVKDLEVIIAPVTDARPGFDATYKLIWRNKGNTTLSGQAILTFDNSRMAFVSSVLPSTVVENQVIFNFNNLKPYANTASEIKFTINPPTHPTNSVNNGDILNFMANVTPLSGDANTEDNSFNYKQTVVGSFDPNDITCLEGNQIPLSMVGKDLHYIVNFENTGTASAVNIVVEMDINSDDFDINTLQLQNTSHNTYTKIKGNKVEFMMKDINLAALAHGNIALKIKTKNNLVSGDTVMNKANIYFDYNFPVGTNEATTNIGGTTLSATDVIKDKSKINVYPNPTKGDVNINADSNIKNIEIYDAQGRIVQKQIGINSLNTKISLENAISGMYMFKIITEKETVVTKVIKN